MNDRPILFAAVSLALTLCVVATSSAQTFATIAYFTNGIPLLPP